MFDVMELNFKKYGSGQPLVILHGLFGSADNWQTLGKRFAEEYEVYLVDQRNHGHSPHSEVFNYAVMAQDLFGFFRENHLYDVILLGHSMGGKTAMTFAQKNPDLIEKLIVADIGVKGYPMHHGPILEALNAVQPTTRKSRSECEKVMSQYLDDVGVRQFLLKNLYWKEKGLLDWRFNLPVLERELPNIVDELEDGSSSVNALFVRGAKSNYIVDGDEAGILEKFPNSKFATIESAGHWLHAEAPDEFYDIVTDFIES